MPRPLTGNGNALRARRLELGLSQAELARRAKVGQTLVSAYERGTVVPSVEVAIRLARALRLKVESIWG